MKQKEEKDAKQKEPESVPEGAVPSYLLDREGVNRTKVLSNMIKQKRKEKAGKWQVPIPKVKAMTEEEMFKVMRSGKRKSRILVITVFMYLFIMCNLDVFILHMLFLYYL